MIVENRIVQLGNIVQGRADVFVFGIDAAIGFVEKDGCYYKAVWDAFDPSGVRINPKGLFTRAAAIRALAEHALKLQEAAA